MKEIIPQTIIEKKIYVIRGQKVMLDSDLADLYGVETRTLNQAVKRNIKRFPKDFMFQLTKEEFSVQRSQIVIFEKGKGRYPKYLPYMFTEQGIAMLSSVLNSERAILVNIEIMRALRNLNCLPDDFNRRNLMKGTVQLFFFSLGIMLNFSFSDQSIGSAHFYFFINNGNRPSVLSIF